MRRNRRDGGRTAVEAVVGVCLGVLVVAIAAGCLVQARREARRMECTSQMRQIGLAVLQYEKHYVCMPNAQWNIYRQIGEYLGIPDGVPPDPTTTAVFRCPSDEYIPDDEVANGLSYAPLVDSGYFDGDDDGVTDGNLAYCAWSYFRTGFDVRNDGKVGPDDAIWNRRNLTQIAPDTVLLTEFWASTNRVNPGDDHPAGYLLFNWSGDTGDDGTRTGQGGTLNFSGQAVAASGTISKVADVGGYTFLAQFGWEAEQTGRDEEREDILHNGAINLLHGDGAVLTLRVKDITGKSPRAIPLWTRRAD